jgi:hypothetical protein
MKGQRGLSLVSTIVVNGEVLKGNGLATANEKTKKRDRSEGIGDKLNRSSKSQDLRMRKRR